MSRLSKTIIMLSSFILIPAFILNFSYAPSTGLGLKNIVHAADDSAFSLGFWAVTGKIQPVAGVKQFDSFTDLAVAILKVGLALVAIIAIGAVVWGGAMYIMSIGDEQRATTAKKIILYAVIGLLVIGVSAIAVNLFINIFLGGGGATS